MQQSDLLDELRRFRRSDSLKRVSTTVTTSDGQQYVETLQEGGNYSILQIRFGRGYVLDDSKDIAVCEVLEGLLLGSQDLAMEKRILKKFEVEYILNVGYGIPNYFLPNFYYHKCEILDEPSTDIRQFFGTCFQFIDWGRGHGASVFVHCNAGVSRAPTIVIAYLMYKYRIKLKEAYALVKAARPCIRPNNGFMKALLEYEIELFGETSKAERLQTNM